jgi:ABC-type Fe3+/spermidine/putrescine transport system ATPase subunit
MTGLSIRGLTLAIPSSPTRPCIEDISLSAARGAVTAILGPSSAGKTLLLAGIAGLIKPIRGAVFLDGNDVTHMRAAKRGTGLLPPGTDLGGERVLAASLRRIAGRANAAAVPLLLQEFGLETRTAARVTTLSHGEAFAALAASRLLPAGDALLVDEAGTGLDGAIRQALMQALRREAARGRVVLIATRDASLALQADQLLLLQNGEILQSGTPATLYAEPRDSAAALLTGPANILRGTVRQKMPGGFIWAASGQKFMQAEPAVAARLLPVPALGHAVALSLRPERLVQDAPGNAVSATVGRVVCHGAFTQLDLTSALGPLVMHTPGPPRHWPGQPITAGWDAAAAWLLRDTQPAPAVTQTPAPAHLQVAE